MTQKKPVEGTKVKPTVKKTSEAKSAAETVKEVKTKETKSKVTKEVKPDKPKTEVTKEVKAEKPKTETVKTVKVEKPKTEVAKTVKEEKPAAKTAQKAKTEVVKSDKEEKTATKTVKTVKEEKPAAKAAQKAKNEKPKAEETKTVKTEKPAAKTAQKPKTETTKAEETKTVKAEKPKAKATKTVKTEKTKTETAKAVKEEKPKAKTVKKEKVEKPKTEEPKVVKEKEQVPEVYDTPRRSVAFIGSECYPFVKTGGLGDVMYALPKALVKQNCDVRVILPRYKCIPQEYQEKMVYRGAFDMDLCSDGRTFYVGIMEYVWDGVVYDFIDNEEFFSAGDPYISLIDDIPKYCYFAKAALAALLYMDWIPNIIHCHDWQAALSPVYLRTLFENTKLASAKTILTIHNLRFQGIYNIPKIRYWSGLPDYVFNKDALKTGPLDANMLKGGLAYCNIITTVSNTYAGEIQTPYYGEGLDAHLRYHSGKLRGIVNGIDYDVWNTSTDSRIYENYDAKDVLKKKKENKLRLQEELGLAQDENKFVIGLISRLTNQKGLDLLNAIVPQIMDEHTQVVIVGTGDAVYEDSFRYYENAYKGRFCANIMYDETRSHRVYAGSDALLVPSQFEPCGLTQLTAMHYGTIPIVRETGGLKDTVEPYNMYTNEGNGFTFDNYDAGLLLDAINRAKTVYFTERERWNEMIHRDMDKDLSWENSAKQYKDLYLELASW